MYLKIVKKKFILFDFDGVIANSFSSAFKVKKLICPNITEDQYKKGFEGNINDWEAPKDFHSSDCRHDIDFFEEYVPLMEKEVKIYPGMRDVIMELEKNYSLIVISSTITSPIQKFLDEHQLSGHFLKIMGNDVHKSKVEKMKMVFEMYNVSPKDCIFVTDTLGDMREAEKVDVQSIAVTWGFHTPETLLQGNPSKLVDQPEDLLAVVGHYFRSLER